MAETRSEPLGSYTCKSCGYEWILALDPRTDACPACMTAPIVQPEAAASVPKDLYGTRINWAEPSRQPNRPILTIILSPRESDPRIWVARCPEKGYVATGVGQDEARDAMLEIIRLEHRGQPNQERKK